MSQYSQIRRAGLPSIYVYTVPEDLPLVNITAGTIAFIESISGLFIYNNGWRPLSTSEDGPVITAAPLSITVESGTIYTATIEAYDPDELPIIYTATTTGNIAENTEVNIDEDTGVLTVLSNNPYNDNFSIILTASDGVFATTRTIPVTITNREPVFTVEPAASLTTGVGVEFSYQYTATDLDDSTVLDFSVGETVLADYVNYQPVQRIVRDASDAWGGGNVHGFGLGAGTGGDYLVLTPGQAEPYFDKSPVVYKWNDVDSKFEKFQWGFSPWNYYDTKEVDTSFVNGSASKYCVAVNNDFLFVSQLNEDSTWSGSPNKAKIMKYDEATDQFIDWPGGDIAEIVLQKYGSGSLEHGANSKGIVYHRMKDAQFVTTENGETALIIVAESTAATEFPMLWIMVYNETQDRWEAPLVFGTGINDLRLIFNYTPLQTIQRWIINPRMIIPNPYKNEVVVSFPDAMIVIDYTLTPQTVTVDDVEEIQYTGTINREILGAAGVICSNGGAFWEDADTLWISTTDGGNPHAPDGGLRKIVRGDTLDAAGNNSHWLPTESGLFLDDTTAYSLAGSATHTIYTHTGISYSPNNDISYGGGITDRLVIKPTSKNDIIAVGSIGRNTFTVNGSTNQVQHLDSLSDWQRFVDFDVSYYSPVYGSSNNELRSVIYNQELGLVIAIDQSGTMTYDGVAIVYGFGNATSITQQGEVTVKPASFGDYTITTSVSDSIDTISDAVSVSVPGGVNFTLAPPASKTIDALSTQTFEATAESGNYADNISLKFSSDLEYTASTIISDSTDYAIVENDLFVLINGEVRKHTIDSFGVPSIDYEVFDTSSLTPNQSKIEHLYATDDYLILGKRYDGNAIPTSVSGRLPGRFLTSSWGYTFNTYGGITGYSYIFRRYSVLDMHQADKDGSRFLEFNWTIYRDVRDDDPSSQMDSEGITMYEHDPILNKTKDIATINLNFVDDDSKYEGCNFIRSYHPDRDYETLGSSFIYVQMKTYNNAGDAEVKVLEYTDSTITLLDTYSFSSDASYNHDNFYMDVSSDGEWFATVYGPSSDNRVFVRGPDENGDIQTWEDSRPGTTSLNDGYASCGFIKINNEQYLVTLNYLDYTADKYTVEVWELPTTSTGSLTSVSSFDVLTSDPDSTSLEGPITSNDSGDVLVGNWLFTVNTLTRTLTKHSVLNSAITGVSGGYGQRTMYISETDTFFTYSTPRSAADQTGSGDLYSGGRAWRLNPITKSSTEIDSFGADISSSYSTGLGVNRYGDFIALSVNNGTVLNSNTRSTAGKLRYVGSTYGQGSLIPFKKENDAYVQKGILTTNDYPSDRDQAPYGHKISGLIKQDLGDGRDYLTFGYTWFNSNDPQGRIYRYYYDTDTASWIKDTHKDDTFNDGSNYGHNNVGYNLAQYQDFFLEAGPRNTGNDDSRARYGMLTIYGNRLGQIFTDGRIYNTNSVTQSSLNTKYHLDGYAEQTLANTYIAWGNTGSRGAGNDAQTSGKLVIFNSVYNSPNVPITTASKFSPTYFRDEDAQVFETPTGYDSSYSYTSSAEIELSDVSNANRAKQFNPSGDYTIEFHYRHNGFGDHHILNTATYTGNFFRDKDGLKLYIDDTDLIFCKNWAGDVPNITDVKGVYWQGVAPTDNVWRHFAIVYDSIDQDFTLWVNGERIGLGTVGDNSYVSSNPPLWGQLGTDSYHWNIGQHRAVLNSNTDYSGQPFDFANLIVTFDKEYDPNDEVIDLSAFEDVALNKIKPSTWLAIGIGSTFRDLSTNHNLDSTGTLNRIDAPDIYTPVSISNNAWVKYLDGTDNLIVAANNDQVFVFNRDVDNKFYFENTFSVSGTITKIKVLDNSADTIIIQTKDQGTKSYNKTLQQFLSQPVSVSNGIVTLSPKLLGSGIYNIKTIASDGTGTSIKNTAITQNPVLDLSSVTDRTVILEWGSTDTQTLPVSNEYTTTWSTQFTNPGNPSGQLQLSGNTLTVTPGNVSHDTFAANLIVSLGGETETVANYKYQTYAPWKYGPADEFDYATEDRLTAWRGITPDLDGNDSADQSYMYGHSVSMSEIDEPNTTGYLVVGQPRSNWDNTSAMTTRGEVYVYQWNDSQGLNDLAFLGSGHRQRLQNSITFGTDTNADGQHFGWVVDITPDGETILATAPGINTTGVDETQSFSGQAGAVIYTRQSDGTHAVSTSIDFADISLSGSQLGTAAAISDDASTIVFGSANYPLDGNQYGLVSIWRKDNSTGEYSSFSLIDHITNNWAAASNTGKDVAVSADGSVVVVGQPGDSNAQNGAVLVYRYTTGGYQLVQTLSQNLEGDDFGYSVAITPDGGTIVVGTPGRIPPSFGDTNTGGFIVYDGNTTNGYTQTFVYTPEISTGGVTSGERIGTSVTIDKFGSTIIAGGPYTSGDPRTGGSRSVNNYQIGHVYTAYKTSGSWNKGSRYIPDAVDNYIRGDGTFASNSGWKNKTFGYSVALSPNGNHLAVGDPTLGGEVPYTTPEVVYTFTPAVIRLRQQILDLNPTLFNTSNINRSTGTLVTINPITMGTGSPISIELPVDFWPTGIGSISDYSANVFSGSGGVSSSFNSSTNSLVIAHTRNTSTVSQGFSLISLDLSFKTINSNFILQIRWQ